MIVEIRQPSAEELGCTRDIWAACWPEPVDPAGTKEMPHFAPREVQDAAMLYVDGDPVSCVVFGRRELLLGTARLRLGAIGDVATKSPYQRRGFAGRLMIEAVRRMAERGDHVSALFCFSFEYYRRFGWEIAGDYWGLFVKRAEFGLEQFSLPKYGIIGEVRPYEAGDLDEVARLHAATLARRGWGLVRPEAYWEWLGGWLSAANCDVVEDGSELAGYLVSEVTPRLQLPDEFTFRRNDDVLWPGEVGPVLHIVEMVVGSQGARHALVGHTARRLEEMDALAYPLACRSDLEAAGLLLPPARVQLAPAFMFRVVNVAEAVRALGDLPGPDPSFSLVISDPTGINREPVGLRSGASGLEVVPGLLVDHQLRMDIQAFSQIFAGYRRPSELRALGRLDASSDFAVAQADRVFVRREPYIGELDLF